jgi:hypothetical protein
VRPLGRQRVSVRRGGLQSGSAPLAKHDPVVGPHRVLPSRRYFVLGNSLCATNSRRRWIARVCPCSPPFRLRMGKGTRSSRQPIVRSRVCSPASRGASTRCESRRASRSRVLSQSLRMSSFVEPSSSSFLVNSISLVLGWFGDGKSSSSGCSRLRSVDGNITHIELVLVSPGSCDRRASMRVPLRRSSR